MADGQKYEILAPAGSIEQLQAAVYNGCDSVYLGLADFNARLKAPNFTKDNIAEWVDFCHLFGVKVYVTVNTSVKNDEFSQALQTLLAAYKANADGVIVTDLALLHIAGQLGGNLDVVASTQLNCHDRYGAEFLKRLGATTVVCARECSLEDIKSIADTGVKTETFIHGALCVCQSGQCLMSSVAGGNSGNRGLCAQPCRNYYTADGGKSGYLLSPADLDGSKEYADLQKNGATVFKIEGRNRSAEYAAVCSAAFKQLFERGTIDKKLRADLTEVYKRGDMQYLPYLKGNNDNIIYTAHPRHIGRYVGVVRSGSIVCDVDVCKGDGFKIFDKQGKEVCGAVALADGKIVQARFSGKVVDGMKAFRTSSAELSARYLSVRKTLDVSLCFTAYVGQKATLTARHADLTVTVQPDEIVQQAKNAPTTREQIVEQLQKSGNSYSTISDIVVQVGNIFLPKSQINALRRQALEKLQQAIVDRYNSRFVDRNSVDDSRILKMLEDGGTICSDNTNSVCNTLSVAAPTILQDKLNSLAACCIDKKQISLACKYADIIIYKPQNIDRATFDGVDDFVYLDLPSFADLDYIKSVVCGKDVGIVCHNVGHVQFARDNKLRYILGRGMNIFNDRMLDLFADRDGFVCSYELTLSETSYFIATDGYVFVDGALPLMQLVHCPYKVALNSTCDKCKAAKSLVYIDEKGNDFYVVRRRCGKCTFELFNGRRLSVCGKLTSGGRYLVDFDEAVLQHYAQLNKGVDDGYRSAAAYTKGRLYNRIN